MVNKKIFISVAACVMAIIIICAGVLAFFFSNSEVTTGATAGTVKVSLSGINFENSGNINPGDGDPENPDNETRRDGTPHSISFFVENVGNKSVRTRNEITISAADKTLDASVFVLYKYNEDGTPSNVEVVKKYYEVNGEYISEEEYNNITGDKFCSSVRYVIAGDYFDGVGSDAEIEELTTVKANDEGKAIQRYTYSFAMKATSLDAYQGARVDINVTTYAAQYRNTTGSNWYKVGSDDLDATIAG